MDVFELCAFKTPQEGAAEALKLILRSGMPANIRVGELREDQTEFDPEAGLLHLVCTYSTPATNALAQEFITILLEYGANWMMLDGHNKTAGDIAYELNKPDLYAKIVRAGVTSEIVLQSLLEDSDEEEEEENEESKVVEGNQKDFLQDKLVYDDRTLQTSEKDGVMMDWEQPIMKRSAEVITKPGGVVLNIGFGMGIIDGYIQERQPSQHYIIEAHPAVLKRMRELGWYDKPNIVVLEGTWKERIPELMAAGTEFDGIYYDTFSEHYKDMLVLFEYVVDLLSHDGVFSYFNGLGADRQVCYDVYKQVAAYNLSTYGLELTFEELAVEVPPQEWEGIKREYFQLRSYALPKVTWPQQLTTSPQKGQSPN